MVVSLPGNLNITITCCTFLIDLLFCNSVILNNFINVVDLYFKYIFMLTFDLCGLLGSISLYGWMG